MQPDFGSDTLADAVADAIADAIADELTYAIANGGSHLRNRQN